MNKKQMADELRGIKEALQPVLREPNQKPPTRCSAPTKQAKALLSQVLASLHGIDVPIVQFVQISRYDRPSHAARDLAEASLAWMGRTLLVKINGLSSSISRAGKTAQIYSSTSDQKFGYTSNSLANIVPDTEVRNLFHAQIGSVEQGVMAKSQTPTETWLGEVRSDFQFLILDCGSLLGNPGAIELASRCHATIFTVEASTTTLMDIRNSVRQIKLGGGRLLGTVFYTAQSWNKIKSRRSRPRAELARNTEA